jgi:hypothetical protein
MTDIPSIAVQREQDRAAGRVRRTGAKLPELGITAQCRAAGVSRRTYYARRKDGLSHEAALSPVRRTTAKRRPDRDINAVLRSWR